MIGGVLGLCVTVGCSRADDTGPSFTVTDSADLEVVTSHRPAWSRSEAWRVTSVPLLTIGDFDGPPELVFGRIQAVGWLPDRRIFVADDRAHSLRIYSPTGEHLGTFGREGAGPGEIQRFTTVSAYREDSLFVYDLAQRAVSVFDQDLSFVRRFANPTHDGYQVVAALRDGRFLLSRPAHNGLSGGPGLVPDTSLIVVSASTGFPVDTVGSFEATVQSVGPDRRNRWLFLEPHGSLSAGKDRIIWTEGDMFEYVESDPDGSIRRVARTTHRPVQVTSEITSEFKTSYMEWLEVALVEGTMDQARQSLEDGEYYPLLPAMSEDVKIDALGHVWLGHYHQPGHSTERWEVFDLAGVWLGTVETPPGFEVHEIGTDRVLGVAKDEYDVPYVQVLGLDRVHDGAS